MLIPSIFMWCLMGYSGGWIFANKGYPPRLGIAIGVLCGPCMLVICLFLPKTKAGKERAKPRVRSKTKLPTRMKSRTAQDADGNLGTLQGFAQDVNLGSSN